MLRYLLTVAITILSGVMLSSQPVLDRDFEMISLDACPTIDSTIMVFSKVETDPVVQSMSKQDFTRQLHLMIDELDLSNGQSGSIKMKILFPIDSEACLREVGFNGLNAEFDSMAKSLLNDMPVIQQHTPGRQRDLPQVCIGLVFITVEGGQFSACRIANFVFSAG